MVRGCTSPLTSGTLTPAALLLALLLALVTVNQVSYRPSSERSVWPLARTRPRVHLTSALTTRGEKPRLSTLIPRKLPGHCAPSRASSAAREKRNCQRCRGEPASYGSFTPLRYGVRGEP